MSGALKILKGHWSLSRSVFDLPGSCWIHSPEFISVQKDVRGTLLIDKTVKLIVIWDAPEVFTSSREFFESSVEKYDSSMTLNVVSNTTTKT